MSNPLFLLGAGFNYDARKVAGSIDCAYPLKNDLYKVCFPDKKNDPSSSIEELFNDSIKKQNFDPIRILYDSIMEADYYLIPKLHQTPSNCYMTFFNKFKESSFLTFNYDSLPELSLLKLDRWYPQDGYGVPVEIGLNWSIEIDHLKKKEYSEKTSRSLVLHLHGSLCIYIKDFEVVNGLIKAKDDPIFKFDPNRNADLFHPYERARLDMSYSPKIEERVIAPVPDKTVDLKNEFIKQTYLRAMELLTDSKILVAIGYNFSKHDKSSYHTFT